MWQERNQLVPTKTRNGDHPLQRSRPFLTSHCFSTLTLCPKRKLMPTTVSSTCNRWSIIDSKWVDYEPVQSGTNPVEFVINPLAEYINIKKTASTLSTSYLNVDKNPDICKDYHTETDFLMVLCLSASFSER